MAVDADVEVVLTPGATPEAEPVVSPTEAGTAPVTESTPAADEPKDVKPERTFTQAELDDIVKKRVGKEKTRYETARAEAELFKRLVMERGDTRQPQQQPAPKADPQRPTLETSKDYDDYVERLADYKAEQKYNERDAQRRTEETARRQQDYANSTRNAHLEREAKARDKYEDYDEIARNPSLPINDAMANTIMLSDNGPDLVYYLGNNLEDARRIFVMPPLLAVKELGKIEAKLATAPVPARPVTRAPAPINPVVANGGPPPSDEPLASDPIAEWVAKRNRAEAKKLGLRMTR